MTGRHLSEVELTEYADGHMRDGGMERAEGHLRACDSCAAALASLRVAAAAAGRLNTVTVPDNLRRRVWERLASECRETLTCQSALPLLHGHVDGLLSPVMALPLQHHLDACGSCRRELTALWRVSDAVRSLTPARPPARIWQQVAARRLAGRPVARAWRRRLLVPATAASLAALGVLAVLLRPVMQPLGWRGMRAGPEATYSALPAGRGEGAERSLASAPAEAVAKAKGTGPQGTSRTLVPGTMMVRGEVQHGDRKAQPPTTLVVARAEAPRAARKSAGPAPPFMPSAMEALRAVAASARADWEAEQALGLTAERFAVLSSEDMASRTPQLTGLAARESEPRPPAAGSPPARSGKDKQPDRNSVFAPQGADTVV